MTLDGKYNGRELPIYLFKDYDVNHVLIEANLVAHVLAVLYTGDDMIYNLRIRLLSSYVYTTMIHDKLMLSFQSVFCRMAALFRRSFKFLISKCSFCICKVNRFIGLLDYFAPLRN